MAAPQVHDAGVVVDRTRLVRRVASSDLRHHLLGLGLWRHVGLLGLEAIGGRRCRQSTTIDLAGRSVRQLVELARSAGGYRRQRPVDYPGAVAVDKRLAP